MTDSEDARPRGGEYHIGDAVDVEEDARRAYRERRDALLETQTTLGEALREESDDDDDADHEPHAEEADAVEPTADDPVTVGSSSKASAYHTTGCEHVRRAPDRRLKHVSQSQLDWHGVAECDSCQRIRERGDDE